MDVITFPVGPIEVNCSLLVVKGTLYVIDPGGDEKIILDRASKLKYDRVVILLTHAHVDHISAVAGVMKFLKAEKVCLGAADRDIYFSPGNNILPYLPAPQGLPETSSPEDEAESSGAFIAIPCPGHSPGGVTYYFKDINTAFVGDTLFFESVGRTDLPGGDGKTLVATIRENLFTLPDDTVCVPGHGMATSIGHEKKYNPYVF